MSGINGDKARFNRRRKQNIQRRQRQRAMFGSLQKQVASARSDTKPREKSA